MNSYVSRESMVSKLRIGYLPKNGKWHVYDHGGFRRDPGAPGKFQALVHIEKIVPTKELTREMKSGRENPPRKKLWVSLTDLTFFGLGSVFHRGHPDGNISLYKPKTISDLKHAENVRSYVDGGVMHLLKRHSTPIPGPQSLQDPFGSASFMCQNKQDLIVMGEIEKWRFYFCSFSRITEKILDFMKDGGASLYDEDQTFFTGDRVFRIAPVREFSDNATAFQLALILASPDLAKMLNNAVNGLNYISNMGITEVPRIGLPYMGKNLRVRMRPTILKDENGRQANGFVASTIISDQRVAPFDILEIVDSRTGRVRQIRKADPETGNKKRSKNDLSDAELSGGGYNPSGPKFRRRSQNDIVDVFPNITGVKIRRLRPKDPKETKPGRQTEGDVTVNKISKVSSSDRGGVGGPGVVFGPALPIEKKAPHRMQYVAGKRKTLFDMKTEVKRLEELHPATEILDDTASLTYRSFRKLISLHPEIYRAARIWELPSGVLAPKTQPRRVVSCGFEVGSQAGVLLEFVRKGENKESFALGIIIRTDSGVIDEPELRRILSHCQYRVTLRAKPKERPGVDSFKGFWPDSRNYIDLTSKSERHDTKKYNTPEKWANRINEAVHLIAKSGTV